MRKRSLKDRVRSTLDKEFFNLPVLFGNSVELIKNGSLYTFKGNFGGRFTSTMSDKVIPLKKMNSLFKKITNSEITIEAFFMLELHTIIKTMLEDDKIWYKINKKALANLIVKINTETWFRPDEMIEYTYSLDMDKVNKNIALKFKDYQFAMFKRYEYLKNKLGYKGMLLDVATGGGKTLMALALAEGVRADKVFIVTIKQNLQTTWVDALLDHSNSSYYFNTKVDPSDVYTVDDFNKGKPYNDAKYIIFNYEALDKLNGLLDKIKYNNPAIVIDEAHNFVSLKSNRREELIKLVEKTGSMHRFPLSGTAVKDSPLDMAIYIELLDPRANKDSIRIYREVYGSPNKLLKTIAPIRYGDLSIKVEKHELKLDPIEYITLDVSIPNPERYTLANIKADMIKYFDTRTKELNNNEKSNRKRFEDIVNSVRKTSNLTSAIWDQYLKDHTEVRKLYDSNSIYLNPSLAKEVNNFEENAIIPRLNKNEKDEFKDLTVTLKYPVLKVRGEVLGRVVLQARINCHREMAERIDYSILSSTLNKSVIMSSYVPVCESARDNLVKQGFKPIEIYGGFTKDQDSRIRAFKNDPDEDPLVGTYKSISTAHHFTVADMILLLDTPFRTYILDQAIARAWRTGQKNQVKIIYTRLNIKEDNINSRNIDILKWAKSMVEEITGNDISYLDFDKGKSIENIDIESIDEIVLENENQDEEDEMRKRTIKERLEHSTVIDNDTGVITDSNNTPSTVDAEGFIDAIKRVFTRKQETKAKNILVDCTSDILGTRVEDFTGNGVIRNIYYGYYNMLIDDVKTVKDVKASITLLDNMSKDLDKLYSKYSKKVPARALSNKEINVELFDVEWGFDNERDLLEDDMYRNEDTINYINGSVWIDDNGKELIPEPLIKELKKLNETVYSKLIRVYDTLESNIKVNKIDKEEYVEANGVEPTTGVDSEGIKDIFKWIKDITTSDKTKMKDYGIKTNYVVYNIMDDAVQVLGGEFLEKGISYLDEGDETIPVHIDEVEDATNSINDLLKTKTETTIITLDTKSSGDPLDDYDTYKDLIKNYGKMADVRQNLTIKIGMTLLKNKKLSEGFKWYVDMANEGLKTYKEDKDIVKALSNFKKAIESLISYVDSNTKLVKIDNSKIDAEAMNSIATDDKMTEEDAIEIGKKAAAESNSNEAPNTDGEAIMLPIAIAGGAYIGYKALEAYVQDNYGKVRDDKFVDYNSFDTANGSNKEVVRLNNISADIMGIGDLVSKSEDHLLDITSENIRVADLEAFDVFKGLASAGLNKANKAIDRLKSMLKTNEQNYRELSTADKINMEKEIGIPRGFKGSLLDASEDILKASVNISTLKSNIDTAIGEISTFINSETLRESSIFDSSFIKVIDKNSKELYTLNTKYLTNDKTDRIKIYELINNFNDISIITTNLRNASRLINPSELTDIKTSLSMVDELIKAVVANQNKFSKVKMKELGLLVDHLISYVGGVATLVYLKNSLDIMLDDIKRVI